MDIELPGLIKAEMEQRLDVKLDHAELFKSGMHNRAYLVRNDSQRWVAKLQVPKKAILAQEKAASLGIRVPRFFGYGIQSSAPKICYWTIEEYIEGKEFVPERFDRESRLAVSVDLGRQLRLLHAVGVEGFGWLQRDSLRGQYPTWREWIGEEQTNVKHAARLADIGSRDTTALNHVYYSLQDSYDQSARLCHGDFAADNLLVEDNRLVAVIDWDNVMACDPAHDVAYWFLWHGDHEYLESLLTGYVPEEPERFRQRVMAHRLLLAAQFVVWYAGQGDREGLEYSRQVLRQNLD